jgi:hypothetical protein
MRILWTTAALMLAAGCYTSVPFGEGDSGGPGDSEVTGDGGDELTPDVPPADDGGADEVLACGDEKEPRAVASPIVNGTEGFDPEIVRLSDGQVLAIGAMLERDWSGNWTSTCTATLVAPTVVLTAAHCVRSWMGVTRAADLRFGVGADMAEPVNVFEVAEVHVNPEYSPSGGGADQARGDEAVLILTQPADEVLPEIVPLPINRDALPEAFLESIVQNVGFGSTEPRGGGDNTRRWWTTELVTVVSDYDYTVNGGGVSSVCFGDSGGPGLWIFPDDQVHVAGTVSWGDESCMDNDHFARTDYNLEFLLPFVGDEDPCAGLGWYGRCDGDVALWCIDGVTYSRDCAGCEQTCGDAGPSLGYYCL